MSKSTLVDFLSRVETILLENGMADQHRDNGDLNYQYAYGREDRKKAKKDPHLIVEWVTGGVSGGSCWGGSNYSYTNEEPPPELTSLDVVLEFLKPDLTFLQYKRLVASVVKVVEWTVDEYYGNSRNYRAKKVQLSDLFDFLSKEGWL